MSENNNKISGSKFIPPPPKPLQKLTGNQNTPAESSLLKKPPQKPDINQQKLDIPPIPKPPIFPKINPSQNSQIESQTKNQSKNQTKTQNDNQTQIKDQTKTQNDNQTQVKNQPKTKIRTEIKTETKVSNLSVPSAKPPTPKPPVSQMPVFQPPNLEPPVSYTSDSEQAELKTKISKNALQIESRQKTKVLNENKIEKQEKGVKKLALHNYTAIILAFLFFGIGLTGFLVLFNNVGYKKNQYRINADLMTASEFTISSTIKEQDTLIGIENPISVFLPKNEKNASFEKALACFAIEIKFNKITKTGEKVNLNSLFSLQIKNSNLLYNSEKYNIREIGNKQFVDVKSDELLYFNTILEEEKNEVDIFAGFMLKGSESFANDKDSSNENVSAGDKIEITVKVFSSYPSEKFISESLIGSYHIKPSKNWIDIIEAERIALENKTN